MTEDASHSSYFYLSLMVVVVLMHSTAQLLYKSGVHEVRFDSPIRTLLFNFPVLAGYILSFAASLLYLRVIRHVPLTVAFPSTVMIQVFVLLGAHYIFGEEFGINHWIGFALICAGMFFLWR